MAPEDPADPPTLPRYREDARDDSSDHTDVETGREARRRYRRAAGLETLGPDTEPPTARAGTFIAEDATAVSGSYIFGDVIGRGGMGEVMLAHDRRIGRDVALKRLRTASPTEEDIARFLREARIQARLDHPAIVPVYELSRDEVGRPYFTMKRLAGVTLVEMLATGRASRQRLLRAFADVCRAVDFAHSRGVVHRDLKPANVVLGDFGEVYVLDWGVARVVGDAGGVVTADIDTLEGSAPLGQVLGTPGYMAPEQLTNPDVGRAADIYALGSILFELLAGEPLHPRNAAVASTRFGTAITSPATRRPDRAIPPELDALCTAMLVMDGTLRPTARRCADGIEEFLDGDRDVARRRHLATELVWQARAALDAGLRADAMRAASRALALDPQAPGAGELVTTLMLEPPREQPDELREAIRRNDADAISRHARAAMPGYILIAAFLPVLIYNGVRDWLVLLGTTAFAVGMAYAARQLVRRPDRSFAWMLAYAIGNSTLIGLLARVAGSFTFVAALVSFITASVITYPVFLRRPVVLVVVMMGSFLVPVGLEVAGMVQRTWQIQPEGLLNLGGAMRLDGSSAVLTIVLASIATVVMAGLQSVKLGRANRDAQHRLETQAWHLRQLLPNTTLQ